MNVYASERLGHSGFYVEDTRRGAAFCSSTPPGWTRQRGRLNDNGYLYLANYYAVYR